MLERPWLEADNVTNLDPKIQRKRSGTDNIWIQFSSTGNFKPEIISDREYSGSFDIQALAYIIKQEIYEIKARLESLESALYDKKSELKTSLAIKDPRTLAKMQFENKIPQLNTAIELLEIEIESVEDDLKQKRIKYASLKNSWSDVKEDVWPLMAETQSEVASRGLCRLISDLNNEALGMDATIKSMMLPKTISRKRGVDIESGGQD